MSNESITVGATTVAAYSHAKIAHGFVFTSGITCHDPDTGEVRGSSIEEETELALGLLKEVLAQAGCTFEDLVRVNVFLDDIDGDFAGFDATYKSILPAPYPPRATVGSHLPGYRLELMAIAARPE